MSKRWLHSDPETIQEIVREGEAYLAGQLTLATSADQRATILGGVYVAAGTAIMAGLISAIASGGATIGIVIGALIAAGLFLVGAGLCISTALPAKFFLPGTPPEHWYEDLDDRKELHEALGEQAENYQSEIQANSNLLKRNAPRFLAGAICGIAAPVAGILAWFLASVTWPQPT